MTTGRVFSDTRPALPCFAPNGTEFKFNKQVWNRYEIFFLNPGRVRVLPHPTPFTYKILKYIYFSVIKKFNSNFFKKKLNGVGRDGYGKEMGMRIFFNKQGRVGRGATHPEPAPLSFLSIWGVIVICHIVEKFPVLNILK